MKKTRPKPTILLELTDELRIYRDKYNFILSRKTDNKRDPWKPCGYYGDLTEAIRAAPEKALLWSKQPYDNKKLQVWAEYWVETIARIDTVPLISAGKVPKAWTP